MNDKEKDIKVKTENGKDYMHVDMSRGKRKVDRDKTKEGLRTFSHTCRNERAVVDITGTTSREMLDILRSLVSGGLPDKTAFVLKSDKHTKNHPLTKLANKAGKEMLFFSKIKDAEDWVTEQLGKHHVSR